jgi:putative SOS response-associated peptidase YedK
MCGRFTSLLSPELLSALYEVPLTAGTAHRYNIAPTQNVRVVRQDVTDGRYFSAIRWGLIPHWAKDKTIGNRLINARSETIHDKPAFRQAIRSRRCVIPASGFYEWRTTQSGKVPYYITMSDGTPFSFAGIWESWKAPEGETLETFAILTTTANNLMAPIHDRMPVILHRDDLPLWLDRAAYDPLEFNRLYQPYPAELMQSWQVSTRVNNPAHDTDECIKRLE